jgi:hypothetical protein
VSTDGRVHTPRENKQTSYRGRSSPESLTNHLQEGKQMTAVATMASASADVIRTHVVAPTMYGAAMPAGYPTHLSR